MHATIPDTKPPVRSATRSAPRRLAPLAAAAAALALVLAACSPAATATPAGGQLTGSGSPASNSSPTSAASSAPSLAGDSASGAPVQRTVDGSAALAALQSAYESVVKRVAPSVVVIETSSGLGSGVIFDAQGDIVTNAHVVGDATRFAVTLANGKQYQGTLVGTFVANDIAVVKISASGLAPAIFADSSRLQVGQIVMAVGNPLGLQTSVTEGIVSALGRTVVEPGGVTLPGTIQTSADINPGNSGGALVDISGDVVGIPTLAAVDQQIGGSAPGIGFAIPSNDARDFATQLIRSGKVTSSHRAYLGIRSADVIGAPGVLVYGVQAGGPADRAGIVAGDLILSLAGTPTPDSQALSTVVAGLEPGQTVAAVVERQDGTRATVQVRLDQIPG